MTTILLHCLTAGSEATYLFLKMSVAQFCTNLKYNMEINVQKAPSLLVKMDVAMVVGLRLVLRECGLL